MSYRVITPAVAEPITLEEAMDHLNVIPEEMDAVREASIRMMIAAARGMLEQRTNRKLMAQTIEFAAHCSGGFTVPAVPLIALGTVSYTDTAGVAQQLPDEAVYVDNLVEPAAVVPAYNVAWPARQTGSPILVRAVVGYASAAEVPAELKMWMLLALTALYDNRSAVVAGVSVTTLPDDFMHLLWQPYMVYL